MPPPIPFPWKRALPGLILCVGAAAVLLGLALYGAGAGAEVTDGVSRVINVANDTGLGWMALALAVSLVSVALSMIVGGTQATGE
jgi:hypothetical protein